MAILSRRKCGLSKVVTHYLVAIVAADLLVVFLDLIFRQIPVVYRNYFSFLFSLRMCNIQAAMIYAATDCSVWFTVAFTFDRCVAICYQTMRTKYCNEKMAAVVLGTVTAVSCSKNIFWCFILTDMYFLVDNPRFCLSRNGVSRTPIWGIIAILHYLLTPVVPFVLVLILNAVTIRPVLVANRARKRLRGPSTGKNPRDPEMESRRKSLILLLAISGNFISIWTLFTVNFIWVKLIQLLRGTEFPPYSMQEVAYMLQLLSCCTNTALYAMTQTLFTEQLKVVVKYPLTLIIKHTQFRRGPNNPLPRSD
ncbi:cysteinyl leukotriene receptor 1-like [Hypanus sabinus]|uniref:cysteinyl leukotriene receptor 1-like n=1 Tax=Hypanus sabinus TaxID=79690 RepID=UPI0028C4B56C|nr:cysteinyl leukotriene receptor 1-like [Hypanus sabinus]